MQNERESTIQLSEQQGVRTLHLGNDMAQSAMRLDAPNDLELAYTRCMMGFLLFQPRPKNILMIGLGGGSLAKYAYYRLLQAKVTVIEVNPQIVAAARGYFFLPADDERLHVVIAEGGEYIAGHPASAEVLMIDGFDGGCQAHSLCTQEFYDSTFRALNENGILVVNLLSRDKAFQNYLERIKKSFVGHVLTMTAEVRGNAIVFAFKQDPGKLDWKGIRVRACKLEKMFGLPFREYARKLH